MASHLPADGSTLAPLPKTVRNGLIAVTTLALLSFVSTALLVLYITYRLIKWDVVVKQTKQQNIDDAATRQTEVDGTNDLSLGLEERHYVFLKAKFPSPPNSEPPTPRFEKEHGHHEIKDNRWNPVLMLIYNLLCANLIEAMAFLLSGKQRSVLFSTPSWGILATCIDRLVQYLDDLRANGQLRMRLLISISVVVWVKEDGIFVPTAACWAQGWFMQVGKLVCSGMLVLISVNTYTTIVKGYKLPRMLIYILTGTVWVIAFAFPLISILSTHNGADHGGFYSRAGAWCWVNPKYTVYSLWLEYFWIFVAMAVTVCLLMWVLFSLQRNNQSARHFPQVLCDSMEAREKNEPPKPSGHHPAFLIYQIIYIICTAPLAISRMAAMTGTKPGWVFYGIAGAMIASHGWLNVLLWSTTIIFIGDHDIRETGLEKFAFLRTPQRVYGNMVMVQGGNDTDGNSARCWWPPRQVLNAAGASVPSSQHGRHGSQESLRRSRSLDQSVIEVEIEAKVVVEDVKHSYPDQGKESAT
ncbi:hypothetical protein PFICI_08447 [Pestalotiopsis fici W106-1]|uniref:Uncharacterized protein n=1 Tax=Pestalotiopsis fici (strain W106-1 / CGMCC3.15140) TaxID=1229662 RepID=W3X451_PESFW|nr:uncharacterized protein PFICI_08447 [Pestalotiopsis fici W106-1]ETS80918.1 hypothetical protein PFICI_08447 [Pestalotiopsis fici W106-1]